MIKIRQQGAYTVKVILRPHHCLKCHYTWWQAKYDYRNSRPLESILCPVCKNSDWESPYYKKDGYAPKADDPDVFRCYCPFCEDETKQKKTFLLRRSWLENQKRRCDYELGQDIFLPRLLTDTTKQPGTTEATSKKDAISSSSKETSLPDNRKRQKRGRKQ